jgi:alkylation response protein AidB-like acyl-CoA dehydrogenase
VDDGVNAMAWDDPGQLGAADVAGRMRTWLAENADELARLTRHEPGDVYQDRAFGERLQRLLYDAGWARLGWPSEAGGLGGSTLLRGVVYDQMWAAGYSLPETLSTIEVLLPPLIRYAPALGRQFAPGLLSGSEVWGQGFSEPEAGSDLASLRTRAVKAAGGWRITGQKIWTSLAAVSSRCFVLARTGPPDSRHRGISAFLVDNATPGVTVRPMLCMTGRHELGEMFFDDVFVPDSRLIGAVDGGWDVAMYMLQFERGMYAWMRQAWLLSALAELAPIARNRAGECRALGGAYTRVLSLRMKTRKTLRLLAAEERPGPEISVDKILLSSAEQTVMNVARLLLAGDFELDDSWQTRRWVIDYLHTRSSSIYGGAVEIQRDLVAQRVLGLPRGR